MLKALPLVFVLSGLALYAVLGGADLGAGFWQLATARRRDGRAVREFAHHAMGPVWETNHVWLIFVLAMFWTSYPKAFGSVMSTLAVPLFIALLGIIFRGITYALREGAETPHESGRIDTVFAVSSVLVPFALGTAIGGIAGNRVPVGNAAGHEWSSWLNGPSIVIGILAVATSAYMAAVYLAADAAKDREHELEYSFRLRAIGSGVVAGAVAISGIFALKADNHHLFHTLSSGRALPAVIVSALAGLTTLACVYERLYEPARYAASLAVAAIVAGWALSRWPTILPGLSVDQAAAPHDILVSVVVVVLAGAVILLPSLVWLFGLALAGRFRAPELNVTVTPINHPMPRIGLRARVAAACFIVGGGMLNLANAQWAHVVGVTCLFGFIGLAFSAIVASAVEQDAKAE